MEWIFSYISCLDNTSSVAWLLIYLSSPPEKFNARMLNYSRNGVCFECSRAPINGATIRVRLEAYHAECGSECRNNDEYPWPRSIGLGEVKWCLGLPGIGAQRFGVGVKFHQPI